MLNFNFINYFILTPFIVLFFFIWVFFIKNNFYYVRVSPGHEDTLKNSNFLKKVNYNFFNIFFICLFFFFFLHLFLLKSDVNIFWFSHLKLNNFILYLLYFILSLVFIMLFVINLYNNKNVNFNIDYFFAVFNLCITIPSIYLCSTLYTFLFFLEINSILIMYKFTVSKYFYLNLKNKKNNIYKNNPKLYTNMLFFQYWINFFSSIILFFSVFNVFIVFGTTDWFYINLLNYFSLIINRSYLFLVITYLTFLISMLVKIGFTPSHLFKIEIYKGLPFISIFFYTIFYFISFFLFFILIFFII